MLVGTTSSQFADIQPERSLLAVENVDSQEQTTVVEKHPTPTHLEMISL